MYMIDATQAQEHSWGYIYIQRARLNMNPHDRSFFVECEYFSSVVSRWKAYFEDF